MAWDIESATATYAPAKNVSAQDTAPVGVTFSGDGTKMFVMGYANKSVYRYDLSTAWDIATATYVSAKDVSSQDTAPLGVEFSGDGTKMFVVGSANDSVYRYDLSTAWDLTTATYVSAKDVGAQDTSQRGVAFSPDGTKMFVVGYDIKSVYRYDLATPWDLTTATYVSAKDVRAQDTSPRGVAFSGDGTKMFVVGLASESVYRYDLTTAWDITSATYVATKGVSAQDTIPHDVAFSGDGTKMFVVGNANDSVYRYDMAAAAAPVVEGTPATASSSSDAEVTAGSLTFAGVLASATSSTLAAVVAATLVVSGTPTEATSATSAAATSATIQTPGIPADATSATDAAPTSEDFSTATPAERTHTIPAEFRLTTIAAENRTTGVLP